MNVNLHVECAHINIDPANIQREDGTFALIADIPAAITIQPGRFVKIPTPVYVSGDEASLVNILVLAGRDLDSTDANGQFIRPVPNEYKRIDALVMNETNQVLVISPANSVGIFGLLNTQNAEAEVIEQPDLPANMINVPMVFDPQHIDASNRPGYELPGSAGFDLRADLAEPMTLAPGERVLIPTGIRVAIPSGFEGQIRPRSGLALKNGITIVNSPGTIDEGYAGICGVVLLNTGHDPFIINPADRIAQMVIAPVMRAVFDFQSELPQTERGSGGFGSTGVK